VATITEVCGRLGYIESIARPYLVVVGQWDKNYVVALVGRVLHAGNRDDFSFCTGLRDESLRTDFPSFGQKSEEDIGSRISRQGPEVLSGLKTELLGILGADRPKGFLHALSCFTFFFDQRHLPSQYPDIPSSCE
jgi:hypothetical protein